MKIYTRTGDEGKTSLFGGKRVSKDSLRIETYGTVDELNAVLGIARSLCISNEIDKYLYEIQNQLFILGADLASPVSIKKKNIPRIQSENISFLEKSIDELEAVNEPLRSFILPGGSEIAAQLHFARTVCRRAERLVVRLSKKEKIGKHPLIFLNRLSDFLFVLARWVNKKESIAEIKWVKT